MTLGVGRDFTEKSESALIIKRGNDKLDSVKIKDFSS